MADWYPFWAISQTQAAPTTVFPLPTSPWSSRFIGAPAGQIPGRLLGRPSLGPGELEGQGCVKAVRSPLRQTTPVPLDRRFRISSSPAEK